MRPPYVVEPWIIRTENAVGTIGELKKANCPHTGCSCEECEAARRAYHEWRQTPGGQAYKAAQHERIRAMGLNEKLYAELAEQDPFVIGLRQLLGRRDKPKAEAPEVPPRDLSLSELATQAAEVVPEIVTGLLPSTGIHCLIGDSHLGKTPLVIQLALCVASGKPFLGMPVKRAKVLLVDFENSEAELSRMIAELSAHVGVTVPDEWLRVFTGTPAAVIKKAERFGAGLIIVDALRGLDPEAAETAANFARLAALLGRFKGAWLLIHHTRKAGIKQDEKRPSLKDAESVMTWLQEASGTRAIINQTAMRLAIDHHSKADLILRGAYKTRSEVGPYLIARELADGEPVGYVLASGRHLLSLNHGAMYDRAQGKTLTFPEAQTLFSNSKPAVLRFLEAAVSAGVAKVTGQAKSKTEPRKWCF